MKPTAISPVVLLRTAALAATVLFSFSCGTLPPVNPPSAVPVRPPMPTAIMGTGAVGAERYTAFFMENSPRSDRAKVVRMASFYIEEGKKEGVNPDVAFVQMCLETGFLSFKGLVTEDMHNFCGLGSIGPGQPGNSFPDERTGVRAHIQHLKAYGSTVPPVLAPGRSALQIRESQGKGADHIRSFRHLGFGPGLRTETRASSRAPVRLIPCRAAAPVTVSACR